MNILRWLVPVTGFVLMLHVTTQNADSRNYQFKETISQEVLENYLSRAVTFGELLNRDRTEKQLSGNVDDNIRFLTNTGTKFAGRTIYMWGGEERLPLLLKQGEEIASKIHQADPDIILQAAAFEIVSTHVEKLPIPAWVFEAYNQPVEKRNFNYNAMLYPDGNRKDHWAKGASVPDMSQLETRMWFLYLSASYLDIGVEAIHFGQVEIMDDRDPERVHWLDMLKQVRHYAKKHARRGLVLCDAHVPSGGIVKDGNLLFDFHSFPLRVEEVADNPEQGILKVGHYDTIYGRSKGGVTPSGWSCENLPYLVEFDNFGVSDKVGENIGHHWIWGCDEIIWFARQDEAYRNLWLHYAWNWLNQHDSGGFLQMPASRTLALKVSGLHWYYANSPSQAVPGGFNQEETIKAIWEMDTD